MQGRIDEFRTKQQETKYGVKTKIGIKVNGVWYGSFSAPWNDSWKEGVTISIPSYRIREREYKGQVYRDITKPDPAYDDLYQRIERLEDMVFKAVELPKIQQTVSKVFTEIDPPPPTDADRPHDDLPF